MLPPRISRGDCPIVVAWATQDMRAAWNLPTLWYGRQPVNVTSIGNGATKPDMPLDLAALSDCGRTETESKTGLIIPSAESSACEVRAQSRVGPNFHEIKLPDEGVDGSGWMQLCSHTLVEQPNHWCVLT